METKINFNGKSFKTKYILTKSNYGGLLIEVINDETDYGISHDYSKGDRERNLKTSAIIINEEDLPQLVLALQKITY